MLSPFKAVFHGSAAWTLGWAQRSSATINTSISTASSYAYAPWVVVYRCRLPFFTLFFFSCRLCTTEHYASFFDVSRGAMIPMSVATWPTDQLDYDLSNQHLQRAQLDRSYGCDENARLKAADRGLSAACRPLCPYAPILSSFLRTMRS